MNSLVSIIIPVYNVEGYILPCLDSVVNQTYKNLEIIIVDDKGTDSSMMLINNFINSYNGEIKIKIITHECNKGLSAARNTGTSEAIGDYIFYLDSDDMLMPECINLLIQKAISSNAEMVTGDYKMVGGDDFFNGHIKISEDCVISGTYNIIEALTTGVYNITAWNKLIKRDFLIKNNLYFIENLLHEDDPWSIEMAFKLNKIAIIKDITYLYVFRNGSISNDIKNIERRVESTRKITMHSFNLVKENPLYSNSKSLFEYNINKLLNYFEFVYKNLGIKELRHHLNNIKDFRYSSIYFSIFRGNLHGSHKLWLFMYYLPKVFRPKYFELILFLKKRTIK